jgi:hypothetical protein
MVLVRDWSQVRKWARVGSLELLGPTGTGTVKFHCEHNLRKAESVSGQIHLYC